MLAIAAPRFSTATETFIRSHVRTIAPGDTVLICHDDDGVESLDCPSLSPIPRWKPPVGIKERIVNGFEQRWRRYVHMGLSIRDHSRTLAFLRDYDVRALLVEYLNSGCLFRGVARRAGVPLYVHAHGYDVNQLGRETTWRRHYRLLFESAEAIITGSKFLKDKIVQIGADPEKIAIIPLGIDTEFFSPSENLEPDGSTRIVAVSRLVRMKGVDLTIRAFARILPQHPRCHLDIIGEGPELPRLETLCNLLDINDNVAFHGVRDASYIRAMLRRADIFAQHCITDEKTGVEGFGLSAIEAMSVETPVVVTRHGAFQETISNSVTGLLVEEHDIEGMADSFRDLIEAPNRRRIIGRAGREHVLRNYTHDLASQKLRRLMNIDDS